MWHDAATRDEGSVHRLHAFYVLGLSCQSAHAHDFEWAVGACVRRADQRGTGDPAGESSDLQMTAPQISPALACPRKACRCFRGYIRSRGYAQWREPNLQAPLEITGRHLTSECHKCVPAPQVQAATRPSIEHRSSDATFWICGDARP